MYNLVKQTSVPSERKASLAKARAGEEIIEGRTALLLVDL